MIYAISDLHTDFLANREWLSNISSFEHLQDTVCFVLFFFKKININNKIKTRLLLLEMFQKVWKFFNGHSLL